MRSAAGAGCARPTLCGVALACAAAGCSAGRVPDPRDAAQTFAAAAARGDGDALYAMLSESSRQGRRPDEVRALVGDERAELADEARAFGAPDARVTATARVRYADGEEVALELRDGRFWITSAGSIPGGARTPEEALDQLRRVLARRSYAGMMRVLSPATRAAVENDLRSLVEGLDRPDTLPVQVHGDGALVAVPGGHQVKLHREAGVWRVDDWD